MKNIFESMVEHPIATVIVIGSIARGIATIIATLKGDVIEPIVKVVQEKREEVPSQDA